MKKKNIYIYREREGKRVRERGGPREREREKVKTEREIDWLIDFYGMSTHIRLFYVKSLENRVIVLSYLDFGCNCFSRLFAQFHDINLSNKNNLQTNIFDPWMGHYQVLLWHSTLHRASLSESFVSYPVHFSCGEPYPSTRDTVNVFWTLPPGRERERQRERERERQRETASLQLITIYIYQPLRPGRIWHKLNF